MMIMEVHGTDMQIELCDNRAADALRERIKKEPLTLLMKDFAHMEKFGELDAGLPQNDEYYTTKPGDVILSEGNLLVVYYKPNTWYFTKIGRIVGVPEEKLKKILGRGNIEATFSILE